MALPLIDIPQFGLQPHLHRAFKRLVQNRNTTQSALAREIVEAFITKEIHNAKVVLGIDVDKLEQGELDLGEGESGRAPPKAGKR